MQYFIAFFKGEKTIIRSKIKAQHNSATNNIGTKTVIIML